jgi:hypothetical protein
MVIKQVFDYKKFMGSKLGRIWLCKNLIKLKRKLEGGAGNICG